MPTSLLDLPDDLLRMICEEVHSASGSPTHHQHDLRCLSQTSQRLRQSALPPLWSNIFLPFQDSQSWNQETNNTLELLSLEPRLWLYVRAIKVDTQLLKSSAGSNLVALALLSSVDVRCFRVAHRFKTEVKLSTTITNILQHRKIEVLDLGNVVKVDDIAFDFSLPRTLQEVELSGDAATRQLTTGDCEALRCLTVNGPSVNLAGAVILWSLDKVAHLSLNVEDLRETIWTSRLLERLQQVLQSKLELCRLSSIELSGISLFCDAEDTTEPLSAKILRLLAEATLHTLYLTHYSLPRCARPTSTSKIPSIRKLILGPLWPYGEDNRAAKDPAKREKLRQFLAFFPSLKVLELRHWGVTSNPRRLPYDAPQKPKVDLPTLQSVQLLLGDTIVEELRLIEEFGNNSDIYALPSLLSPTPFPPTSFYKSASFVVVNRASGLSTGLGISYGLSLLPTGALFPLRDPGFNLAREPSFDASKAVLLGWVPEEQLPLFDSIIERVQPPIVVGNGGEVKEWLINVARVLEMEGIVSNGDLLLGDVLEERS
ncbi:hypothetical protein P7C70_g6522, partial [Phenoliferia sp. Uapishka_3]